MRVGVAAADRWLSWMMALLAAADSSTAARIALDGEPVLERRRGRGPGVDRGEEVADLVGEGVFPADDVALRPPRAHVGVLGFVDQDPAEALLPDGHRGVQEPSSFRFSRSKRRAPLLAVDLQLQGVLLPGGHPGDLD